MTVRPAEQVLKETLDEIQKARSLMFRFRPRRLGSKVVFLNVRWLSREPNPWDRKPGIHTRIRQVWLRFLFGKPAPLLVSKAWRRAFWLPLQITLIAVIVLGKVIFPSHFRAPYTSYFCAPFGDQQRAQLPDGSNIQLNSGACVTAEISARARQLRLESGEAIFQVAHDPSRPFVVNTGPISITALGTQFDVYRKELSTRVTVVEGSVQVSSRDTTPPRSSTKPLTMLQQLDVPDDTAHPMVRRDIISRDFERMTAWRSGTIQFENQSLRKSLDEFARYRHIQFYFEDKHLEEIRFSGVFQTVDVDSFLQLLKLNCIHSEYDKDAQRITLTLEAGKRAGAGCK